MPQSPPADQRMGCINIDVDTLHADLHSGLRTVDDLKLADICWSRTIPRVLRLFEKCNIRGTFFIIGRHLELFSCRESLKMVVSKGHEIANHTMNHNKQFSLLAKPEMEREIRDCHQALASVVGQNPIGFRAPGYSITQNVIDVLQSLGYLYDASLNLSAPYQFLKAVYKRFFIKEKNYLVLQDLSKFQKRRRVQLTFPSHGQEECPPFVMFPINIIPYFHYPFVSAMLLPLGNRLTRLGYYLMRRKVEILNFELHDIEFLTSDDLKEFNVKTPHLTSFYTRIPLEKRYLYFENVFRLFQKDFKLMPFSEMIETSPS